MICLLRSACTVAIFDVVTEQLNIPGRQMKPAGRAAGRLCLVFRADQYTHVTEILGHRRRLSRSFFLCPNRPSANAQIRSICQLFYPSRRHSGREVVGSIHITNTVPVVSLKLRSYLAGQ